MPLSREARLAVSRDRLDSALGRIEELEEIISDLVRNHEEQSVMGTWPGRAEVFRKAWDRAAEAVGLDDGAPA